MPLVIPITYYFLLPHPETFASVPILSTYEEEDVDTPYTPLPIDDDAIVVSKASVALSFEDKWELVKPLLLRYMLPLCACFP
jgi:battenin